MYRRFIICQERGEYYLDFVRRKIFLRSFVDLRIFVYDFGFFSDGILYIIICEVFKGQYRFVKDLGDSRWIEMIRWEIVIILCLDCWVDDNFFFLLGNYRSRRIKMLYIVEVIFLMCVDICFKMNLNLEVLCINVVDLNVCLMEILDFFEVYGEVDFFVDYDMVD